MNEWEILKLNLFSVKYHASYTDDFGECSFHHCLVSRTSPAAFRRRPCTELDSLEIKGATSHSGPLITTDFWLLWAVAKGVVSCRCTKTLMALVAMASRRGPVSWKKMFQNRWKLYEVGRSWPNIYYIYFPNNSPPFEEEFKFRSLSSEFLPGRGNRERFIGPCPASSPNVPSFVPCFSLVLQQGNCSTQVRRRVIPL